MSKQTGWIIVATEGATVDGRTITAAWIKDMAEQYSQEEYTALIWPEHSRHNWSAFEGKNWGTVDALKAAKKGGSLRLFAKITANQYLLDANKDGQKLFTSIEPNPDYRSSGRCYLMGLAVTDSPASTGTTRLKFSMGDTQCDREYSQLEPFVFVEFSQGKPEGSRFERFFHMMESFFTGDPAPQTQTQTEDTDVTEEQLKAALAGALEPFATRLDTIEQKFSALPSGSEEETPEGGDVTAPNTAPSLEQFSSVVADAIKPLSEKLNGLEAKFNELTQEADGQRPLGEGAGNTDNVEAF